MPHKHIYLHKEEYYLYVSDNFRIRVPAAGYISNRHKPLQKSQIKDSAKEQYKSVTNLYLPRNDKNYICTSVPNVNTQEAKPGR